MSAAGNKEPRVLLDYLRLTEEFLGSKGIDGARLDAEVLLAEAVGCSRIELYTNFDRPLGREEVDRYRELVRRRATREPVSYIVGRREFWSLDIEVDRRVLIPRPESELLVEIAIELIDNGGVNHRGRTADCDSSTDGCGAAAGGEATGLAAGVAAPEAAAVLRGAGVTLADIGTGSGALAVALACELTGLRVVASDASAAALEVAPRNAERHGVADRIEFLGGDLFERFDGCGPFDLIVSNPPYVRPDELAGLAPEVRNWEPSMALVASEDGMELSRRLIEQAPAYLKPEGWMLVEVGTQAGAVAELMASRAWRELAVRKDLAGIDRVVVARRPG